MKGKSIDGLTKEEFKQYQDLLEERELKKREYQKLPSNLLTCVAGSRALIRIHWSLSIFTGIGSAYLTYKGLKAKQEYKKLDKQLNEFKEKLFYEE